MLCQRHILRSILFLTALQSAPEHAARGSCGVLDEWDRNGPCRSSQPAPRWHTHLLDRLSRCYYRVGIQEAYDCWVEPIFMWWDFGEAIRTTLLPNVFTLRIKRCCPVCHDSSTFAFSSNRRHPTLFKCMWPWVCTEGQHIRAMVSHNSLWLLVWFYGAATVHSGSSQTAVILPASVRVSSAAHPPTDSLPADAVHPALESAKWLITPQPDKC